MSSPFKKQIHLKKYIQSMKNITKTKFYNWNFFTIVYIRETVNKDSNKQTRMCILNSNEFTETHIKITEKNYSRRYW